MPTKKDKEQKGQGDRALIKDPLEWVVSHVEKKTRNLDKRKARLMMLNEQLTNGKELDKDQRCAAMKLPEVSIQVEALRELLMSFQQIKDDYQKETAKEQKLEEKRQKEMERQSHLNLLRYFLKIERLLNSIDDEVKGSLCSGELDGVTLSEVELTQIDQFYDLLNPERPGNSKYEMDMSRVSEHMLLLYEKSTKAVVNTTYQCLYQLFEKIDNSGCLDRVIEKIPEEEEETPSTQIIEDENIDEPNTEIIETISPVQTSPLPIPIPIPIEQLEPLTVNTLPSLGSTTEHSVPSPDFAGIQVSTFSPLDELTFMRESPTHPLMEETDIHNYSNVIIGDQPKESDEGGEPLVDFPSQTQTIESSSGTSLSDSQFVPETGQQQVIDEKEKKMSNSYKQSGDRVKGSNRNYGQRGGSGGNNKWMRGGRSNGPVYNNGSNSRGYNNGGGGVYQQRNGGGNRGRSNFSAYNSRQGSGGYNRRPGPPQ